jgi:hypothetical protein
MTMHPIPIVPAGSADLIKRLLGGLRDDVCTIQAPIVGLDGTGAPVAAHATTAVVSCRVVSLIRQPAEIIGGGRISAVVEYEVHLPPGTVVSSNDQILVNDRVLQVVADQDAASHGFEVKVFVKAVEA